MAAGRGGVAGAVQMSNDRNFGQEFWILFAAGFGGGIIEVNQVNLS